MPPLWLLLLGGGGAILVARAATGAGHVLDVQGTPAEPNIPKRTPTRAGSEGIDVWGPTGTWRPEYIKDKKKVILRWGLCLDKWRQDLAAQQGGGAVGVSKATDLIVTYLGTVVPVAKWIADRLCMRVKFPLHAYQFPGEDYKVYTVLSSDSIQARLLAEAAPPWPANLPKKNGWKRVWVSTEERGTPNSIRNSTVRTVLFMGASPRFREVVRRKQIRGMLRMDDDYTGAIDMKRLAQASYKGKTRWKPSLLRKKILKEEYK